MPRLKITTEDTPNPNAMKFTLNRAVDPKEPGRTHSYADKTAAAAHPLAAALFALPGVDNVMFVQDFVTVNKTPATKWKALTPRVKDVLQAKLAT